MASHYDVMNTTNRTEIVEAAVGRHPRPVKRRTKAIYLRVPDEIRTRVELRAREHEESISEYVSRLVREDTPRESAIPARLPALLGHRCVAALEACEARIRGGDDCAALVSELLDIRWQIAAVLEALRQPFDIDLDMQNDPLWTGKH